MDPGSPSTTGSLVVRLCARALVGAVFAYAGFLKLMEPPANFQAVLEHYPLLPAALAPFLARTVPWAEWLGGMFLLIGYMTRAGALLLTLLSLGFVAVLTGSVFGPKAAESCGCFGSGLALTVRQAYLLDWATLLLGIFLFRLESHPFALENRL